MKTNGIKFGLILFGTNIIWVYGQTFQLSSSCGGTVQTGGSCTLTCLTSQSVDAIGWNNGGGGTITQERITCSSTSPSLPSGYTSACPTSTTYTISFTNARYDRNSKTWKCSGPFGGSDSNEIQVDVKVPLTSVSLSRTSSSITCVAVSNPRPSITLYRDGVSMATSPSAVNGSNGWTATLNYPLTGNSRNYAYWCQASNTQTSVNSTFSLPQIAVTSVTLRNISANTQEVGAAEGQSLTLTCVTSASYPAASVTWYKNNVQVTTGVSSSTEVTSGVATVTTSSVTLNPLTKSDLGHQVYCKATNQHTSPAVQSYKARLGVWYGPDQVDVTIPANTPAIEYRNLTLTCTVTAYPAPTFTWDYSGGTSTGGRPGSVTGSTDRWSQTLTFRPDRNKPTVRCLTSNIQTPATLLATKTLDIKYPPPGSSSITRFTATMYEGDRDAITCSVTGGRPLADITWSCPGTGSPAVSTSGQTKTSTLTFTVTKGQNSQQCRCQGSWEYGGYSQSDVRIFNVSYPPSKPSVTVPSVVCEGQPVSSLGCSSSDPGNPAATYTWTKNGNTVSAGFSPVRADNGATIRCSAVNIFTDRPGHTALQSDTKTINVLYSPHITTQPAIVDPRKEGDSLSMTCVSDSNPITSDSNIKWVFDGIETQGPRLQTSNLRRHDHGVYMCTATVTSGTCGTLQGHRNVTIVVNYAPDVSLADTTVTEGKSLILSCQAEGRPATYNFKSFTQFWGDTQIQTRNGQQMPNTYTLRIDKASYMDSGVYECSVDNAVTDRNGVLVRRKKVNVRVRARPKFAKDVRATFGGDVGDNISIYQTFFSNENCSYNWTFNGQNTGVRKTESLSATRVTLEVYGKTVQDDGWNVTLTLSGFQERDFGIYTVTVCNSVGCNSSDVNLIAAGPPFTPLDFLIINTTETTMFLRWKSNFPGGDFSQTFILNYRKVGLTEWTAIEVEDNPGDFVFAKVSGLGQGTEYEFRVKAKNSRNQDNESPFTDVITQKTFGVQHQPSSSQTGPGVIVGSVVGILAIGAIIVGIIFLYRRGYRCALFKKTVISTREGTETENTAYSTVDRTGNPSNTYDSLEKTAPQPYAPLKLYENTRVGATSQEGPYESLQQKQQHQQQYESVELHGYENRVMKTSDPTYVNTPKK